MNNFNGNSMDGANTYTNLTHFTADGVAGTSMTIQTVIDKDELKCTTSCTTFFRISRLMVVLVALVVDLRNRNVRYEGKVQVFR